MRLIRRKKILLPVILAVNLIFSGCNLAKADSADLAAIPEYTGSAYTVLNDNIPDFPEEDFTEESFETYSDMDSLGRCGVAYANIGEDLMPTTKRGSIGQVKPSGWHTVKYDSVDGKYLYNRCHLIGYQLTAENANEKNLITGTRYLNTEGMLPFENMVADYIKETGNHVLYRVTPLFDGNNLVATGVQMEAESVEDKGDGILYNVFCYNIQPGITIDYKSGDSSENEDMPVQTEAASVSEFVLNTSSKKFHKPSCSSISKIKQENKEVYKGSRDALISQGYDPCKKCNP
ncbi:MULTISPECIES: DNA/RNA non-specific endonuclease [unclassified Ruminococcus]|uniref:DNA/RNA non-specific endonuclease n=1 Tax=unclassified Ruminococcus TaxID=2608920 RepID=UPI00319E8A5B